MLHLVLEQYWWFCEICEQATNCEMADVQIWRIKFEARIQYGLFGPLDRLFRFQRPNSTSKWLPTLWYHNENETEIKSLPLSDPFLAVSDRLLPVTCVTSCPSNPLHRPTRSRRCSPRCLITSSSRTSSSHALWRSPLIIYWKDASRCPSLLRWALSPDFTSMGH